MLSCFEVAFVCLFLQHSTHPLLSALPFLQPMQVAGLQPAAGTARGHQQTHQSQTTVSTVVGVQLCKMLLTAGQWLVCWPGSAETVRVGFGNIR